MQPGPTSRALRILIDATMARRGGGFTYLVNLVPKLAALAPESQFRVLVRSTSLANSLPSLANVEIVRLPETGFASRLAFTHLQTPRIATRWQAHVHFAAGDIAPLVSPCPVVASFRNPNVFTDLDQGWYAYQVFRLGALRQIARVTARSSARILFVSHDSAEWIGNGLGLEPARRAVIQHGIDAQRFAPEGPRAAHPRPYILSVSSIYRYKNFVRLIEAWTALARRRPETPDLVIAGDDMDPDYSEKMFDAKRAAGPLGERIFILGQVPYDEIAGWYRGARLFAFPSRLETFGHPLLEAMAADVPVVAADLAVSREVAENAALYVPFDDVEGWSDALARGLDDDDFRARSIQAGRERVARFTWEASAQAHLALFDELAEPQTS